MFAYKVG